MSRRILTDELDPVTTFSAVASVTIAIDPTWSRLVSVDYEFLTSGLATVLCRPNNSSTSILVNDHGSFSTESPNAISHDLSQTAATGLVVAVSSGATGANATLGRLDLQARNTGGRRLMIAKFASVNTVGSSNAFIYEYTMTALLNDSIGNGADLSSLVFVPSSGTISGTIRVRR